MQSPLFRLSPFVGFIAGAVSLGGCATAAPDVSSLREEVAALRQAHERDSKRLETLEVQVEAERAELRRLRGGTPEPLAARSETPDLPGGAGSARKQLPPLPTDIAVRAAAARDVDRARVRPTLPSMPGLG